MPDEPIYSGYLTIADVMNLYASMPVEVQCERLEFLLDFSDDEANGKQAGTHAGIRAGYFEEPIYAVPAMLVRIRVR